MTMTGVDASDQPGPVDFLLVEFPPDRQDFTGEMAQALQRLSDAGTIRILRLVVAEKDDGGHVSLRDIGAAVETSPAVAMAGEVATLLADDDLARVTEQMPEGTVVGVVVWENVWAADFAAAARRAGGQVVASGRIPVSAIQPPDDAGTD